MFFSSALIRLSGRRTLIHASHYASRTLIARASSTASHDRSALGSLLIAKLKAGDSLSAIHEYYPALTAELRKTKQSQTDSPLSREQLLSLLAILGSSGRPLDLQRIEEILCDMPSIFGIEPSIEVHTTIIRALIKHGNVRTIHRWLINMPTRPGRLTPTIEQFHLFLEACIDLESFKYMRNLVLSMAKIGCKPTNETFKILIRARWEKSTQEEQVPHVVVFSTVVDDMKKEGLPYDPAIDALLYDTYASHGFIAYADQIRAVYRAQFSTNALEQEQGTKLDLRLSQAARVGGIGTAIKLFRSLQPTEEATSPVTFRSILHYSRSVDDLRTVETEFDIKATAGHWSILIGNNLRTGQIPDAISIYQEMKRAGVILDPALAGSLIRSLCQSTFKPPSEDFLDHALSIYHDLKTDASSSPAAAEDVGPFTGLDTEVYQNLLRGLVSSPNSDKYLPLAKSLLADMEARNMSLKDSIIASSIIVVFLRQSPTSSEALEAYRSLRSSLDEKAYELVLNAFCRLSFGDHIQIPSLGDYFEIVKDMRRAGLSVTTEVYTIFLRQLSVIATQLKELGENAPADLIHQLILTARRTHDLLTLDAAVSPDANVWNQLMNTYQSLGCFADSYRVWDLMYLSGRFDHDSVSIILEACGHAGAWQVAKNVCAKLFNGHFVFNLHNWNTWLECLCRLGKLNDALKVACLEMGKGQNSVVPDVRSAQILIGYSKQVNQQKEVLARIQRHLPELWNILPENLKQS